MTDDIRKREGLRDQTDEELTTADLAGTSQLTQRDDEAAMRAEDERRSAERADVHTEGRLTGDASRSATQGYAAVPAPAMEQERGPLSSGSEANDLRGKWDAIQGLRG